MPFPATLLAKEDWVRIAPSFITTFALPHLHQESLARIRSLRGQLLWIKCIRHTRTAYGYIQWWEPDRFTNPMQCVKTIERCYRRSAITSPMLHLRNVEPCDPPICEA